MVLNIADCSLMAAKEIVLVKGCGPNLLVKVPQVWWEMQDQTPFHPKVTVGLLHTLKAEVRFALSNTGSPFNRYSITFLQLTNETYLAGQGSLCRPALCRSVHGRLPHSEEVPVVNVASSECSLCQNKAVTLGEVTVPTTVGSSFN